MFIRLENTQALPYRTDRSVPGTLWIALLAVIICSGVVVGTSVGGLKVLAIIPGLAFFALMFRYPEIALGALMVIGTFKGAPELSRVPVDLTVFLLLVLGPAMVYSLWRRPIVPLPRELFLYVPIVLMMILSLTYTPSFAGGVDKTMRFILLSGIAIIGPFILLTSPAKVKRFFLTLLVAGLCVCFLAFKGLGGTERLASPSGDTIQLGHDAALGMLIVWFGMLPKQKMFLRPISFVLIGILAVGMFGAGSRGPFLGLVVGVLFSLVFRRRVGFGAGQLVFDFGLLCVAGAMLISVVGIPQASFRYLAQLTNVHNTTAFMGGRAELVRVGLNMTLEHPLLGVGIDGFPHVWTDVGNWPHSIPVELSSELGLMPAIVFLVLEVLAFRTGFQEFLLADKEWRASANLAICFLIVEAISMLNTGNINDNRQLWTSISLVFLLRQIRTTGWYQKYAD